MGQLIVAILDPNRHPLGVVDATDDPALLAATARSMLAERPPAIDAIDRARRETLRRLAEAV